MNAIIEPLEPRRFLSVTIDGNLVTITGTPADDLLRIEGASDFTPMHGFYIFLNKRRFYAEGSWDPFQVVIRLGAGGDTLRVRSGYTSIDLDADLGHGRDTAEAVGRGIIRGGPGPDRIVFDQYIDVGGNTILGGAGDDTITAGYGDDVLSGGAGRDSIAAQHGNDSVFGDDGNDTLRGGGGSDRLVGGGGKDDFIGGAGEDTFFQEHLD